MKKGKLFSAVIYVLLLVGLFSVVSGGFGSSNPKVPHSQVVKLFQDEQVRSFTLKGDTIELTLPVIIDDELAEHPDIILSEYLVYLERGGTIDPQSYIGEVIYERQVQYNPTVVITGEVDVNTPGTYNLVYAATVEGRTGLAVLTVVVE